MTIGVGLIGFGLGGRYFHAPFFRPAGLDLRAVATSRAADVAADHPGAAVLASPEALLARPDIDLVVISTPNETHAPLARAALAAGKHVVIDKPFALDAAEADTVIAAAAAAGRMVSSYQNRRWDGDFHTLQSLVAAGDLGELRYVQIRFDRFRPKPKPGWRTEAVPGGGVLFDLGPHLIDQAMQLIGAPDWVMADVTTQGEGATVDDGFQVTLAKGDTRVVVASTPFAALPQPRLVVHGLRASYVKSGFDMQEEQLRAGMKPDAPGFGIDPAARHGRLSDGATERAVETLPGRYIDFWTGMRRAIETGAPPPVDARQSRDVLTILAAARLSFASGRRIHAGDAEGGWAIAGPSLPRSPAAPAIPGSQP